MVADSVLRCLPEDGTNGFFVACFIRDIPDPIEGEELTTTPAVSIGVDELSHSERQEAFKAKARAKGGKHAKIVPSTTTTVASIKEGGQRIKIVPMPSGGGGKTVVGNKMRIGAPTTSSKIKSKSAGGPVSKVAFTEETKIGGSGALTKELTLEEKVMLKKRKSFEKLAGSVGAAKRAKQAKEREE